jgi:hypothetical protein
MINVRDSVSPFAGSPIATPGGLIPDGMYPSGYIEKVVRDAKVVSHGSTMPYFDEMLMEHRTLHDWAAAQPGRRELAGRSMAFATLLPESEVSVVVRHSQHGGMLANLTRDLFRAPRAPEELRISWSLRHVGIPTPRVLGYALYPSMHGQLWRADVVTREVMDSQDLATVLAGPGEVFSHMKAINATIVLIKQLSQTYAYHPDLNVKNVLIAPDDDGEPMAYVIDVDTLRFAEKNAEWLNGQRLLRSARKSLSTDGAPGFATLIERLGG